MAIVNTDLKTRVVVHTPSMSWVESPNPNVQRRMLERDGDEVARATSVVRFLPGSRFEEHEHGLGEELFVLEGELSDEHGSYPAGTYLRNPPVSRHAPYSEHGCTLFVKLRYMHPSERARVVLDTRRAGWAPGLVKGLSVMPLSEVGSEHTALVRWDPGTHFQPHRHWGGEEILVLEGAHDPLVRGELSGL